MPSASFVASTILAMKLPTSGRPPAAESEPTTTVETKARPRVTPMAQPIPPTTLYLNVFL